LSREIERKFLVERLPDDLGEAWEAQHVEQGYVAITDDAEVRVRRRMGTATLTIKSSPALSRVEVEVELDPERFAALWPLTEGRRVVKTRHTRRGDDGVLLELDVYEDALDGLATLEVEFADEEAAHAWAAPSWAGDDVSGDPRYANQALATAGRPAPGT